MIDLLVNRQSRMPITAKPAGSAWSPREWDGPKLCVVQMADPPAELVAKLSAGGVVSSPFAEHTMDSTVGHLVMSCQSSILMPASYMQAGRAVTLADMEAIAHA